MQFNLPKNMTLSPLTAISPLDGRYQSKLTELRSITSEFGLIYFRIVVEVRWLIHLAELPELKEVAPLNNREMEYLLAIMDNFSEQDAAEVKKIEQTTNHDVKAVEYFLAEKLKAHSSLAQHVPFLHFSCTSEDVNNLAYGLMLKVTRDTRLLPMINQLMNQLTDFSKQHASLPILSRTHGQTATPTTLGKEVLNVVYRLQRQYTQLTACSILGKFNGAVGNFNAHQSAYPNLNWPDIGEQFVKGLGLEWNPLTTQIEPHDYLAEILQNLMRLNTILIDFCRDTWSYISIGYYNQKSLGNEVGSSTMPHKVNPIDFENAEGNLGLANALADHLANKLPISRWQRDLTDSTVLRNLGAIAGYSLIAYQALQKGLSKINPNESRILDDLNNSWEVLAEPIQTVMRRYGVADAYEKLKALTRGKIIDQAAIRSFVETLSIPDEAKQQLSNLTPMNYTGYAKALTDAYESQLNNK
jgi:adenylosuccinate lyase